MRRILALCAWLAGCGDEPDAPATSTTTPQTTTTTTGSPVPLGDCPIFSPAVQAGVLGSPMIAEASGLAVSRAQPGVLWVHNDSGGGPQLFAIGTDGTLTGTFTLQGAVAIDWEDLALGPGPTGTEDWLYVADVGDNDERREFSVVYRFPEPDAAAANGGEVTVTDVEALEFDYPDRPHDAETLFADPETADLYVLTKETSRASVLFRFAAPQQPGQRTTLEAVATLAFGEGRLPGSALASGGDMTDGLIAIRTHDRVFGFRVPSGLDVATAMTQDPCRLESATEVNGEAIAFNGDGSAYFTVGEGEAVSIWRFDEAQ